ncbi:MAG: NADH-quinone oxidoreductase subunit L [Armatimonadetes bacterium]|nr:NADH-quinone oxidoreductase subunit L [Armatimonadota bacterium]
MEAAATQVWWILGLPLLGFVLQALAGGIVTRSLGDKKGRTVMGWVAFAPVFIAFLIAVSIARALAGQEENRLVISTLFDWINLHSVNIPFELRADTLSITMTLVVTGVGALIHMYAIKYMAGDKDFTRFFTYFNLFIAFMLLLVLGNNLAMLFIGWEGVGLCSYLLIGYWYKDLANTRAGSKAFIMNRVGDWGLTLGIFLLVVLAAMNPDAGHDSRWLSYDVLLPNMLDMVDAHPVLATWAAIFLFVGAMGKSAQFPLYVWLPDAMAGPTPVSALIHAATMVTAGVFLLARMSPLYALVPAASTLVVVIGAVTALVGALIAFGQTDIKKVLAYSTVSQLGYMFIACGVGAYWIAIFHLVTHAFFKALLFLGSGAVIYSMRHDQDMRNYGNLRKYIKITFATMFVGWAAIAGLPWLFAGAWSKESILGAAMNISNPGFETTLTMVAPWAGWLGFGVAALTAAYMTRMMMQTFFGGEERWRALPAEGPVHHEEPLQEQEVHDEHGFFYTAEQMQAIKAAETPEHHHALNKDHEPKEAPWEMTLPLVVLALLALGGSGWYLSRNLGEWLYPHLEHLEHNALSENAGLAIGTLAALLGIAYGYFIYRGKLSDREGWDMAKWSRFRRSAANQFGFDDAFATTPTKFGVLLGNVCAWIDTYIVDGIVNLVGILTRGVAGTGKWVQTGFVRSYALMMQLGAAIVVLYAVFKWLGGGGD